MLQLARLVAMLLVPTLAKPCAQPAAGATHAAEAHKLVLQQSSAHPIASNYQVTYRNQQQQCLGQHQDHQTHVSSTLPGHVAHRCSPTHAKARWL